MSLLSLPPHIHSVSPPLHDDEMRQVEEYLADEHAIDAAEYSRLQEYLDAHAAPAPVPDAVSLLAEGVRLLAVPEDAPLGFAERGITSSRLSREEDDEEEIDTHSCADSGCAGEHTHAYYDDDYETGHRSPYAGTPSYMPDTCYEGSDYSRMPDSD